MSNEPLLELSHVSVRFPVKTGLMQRHYIHALSDIHMPLYAGDILAVVGESGCGKSTLARVIAGLVAPSEGQITYLGQDLTQKKIMRQHRRDIQMIFQDPFSALNPRMTIGESVMEPLRGDRMQVRRCKAEDMLAKVGLVPAMMGRYPHELSGGQCQRVGIARALVSEPRLLICDEIVSALDVSIQAQIVNLLMELQRELHMTLIFIAHDLAIVKYIATRVMVMYLGHVVEVASKRDLFAHPQHPYTQALLASVPDVERGLARADSVLHSVGDVPSPLALPSGCIFRTRCPIAAMDCAGQMPPLVAYAEQHQVACPYAPVACASRRSEEN